MERKALLRLVQTNLSLMAFAFAVLTLNRPVAAAQPSVLLNVDFGDAAGTRVGPAATGQAYNDYWNVAPPDPLVINLKTAKGNNSPVLLTGDYGVGNSLRDRTGDLMYDDFVTYHTLWGPPVYFKVYNLPPGSYDIYLYSYDNIFGVSSGTDNYGTKICFDNPPWGGVLPNWTEGKQLAVFRDVAVADSSQVIMISAQNYVLQDATVCGMQIASSLPWVLQQPSNSAVALNSNMVLQVSAEGTPPFAYQRFFEGKSLLDNSHITGANSNTLTITKSQFTDAGNYFMMVTNAMGASTSLLATVQVGIPPSFVQTPSNQTRLPGNTAQFTATATGDEPIGFRWYLNGAPLADDARHSGVTTTNLVITILSQSDAGDYTAVASNAFGTVRSPVAKLTVLPPPESVPAGSVGWWPGDGGWSFYPCSLPRMSKVPI